jgi:hypothetical protein
VDLKKGGAMNDHERSAEFNALICEAQAISIEADAMKIESRESELRDEGPPYNFDDFMRLADEVKKIADKFRKSGGVK